MKYSLIILSFLSLTQAFGRQPNYSCIPSGDSEHSEHYQSEENVNVQRIPGGRYRLDGNRTGGVTLSRKDTRKWTSKYYSEIEYTGSTLEVNESNQNLAVLTVGDDRYQVWIYYNCSALR